MAEKPKTAFASILSNRSAAKLRKLAPNDDDPLILVNVSGVEYKLKSSYLSRFPDSLLYKMVFDGQDDDSTDEVAQTTLTSLPPSYECSLPSFGEDCAGRRELPNVSATSTPPPPPPPPPSPRQKKLFFQRSPLIFDLVILQSYITGKLHVPRWMCAESILEELKLTAYILQSSCDLKNVKLALPSKCRLRKTFYFNC
uniref:Potassium channel tetramerisation-type BTB domain-containing protein n=1 Tax=Romanomermis culicivorax TaxID=13658 RepID=A0A915HQM0_ROMCU